MLVVPELDDPFLPLPDDLLVNLSESRAVVEALLEALPAGYSSSTSNDCAMGPALQVRPHTNSCNGCMRSISHSGRKGGSVVLAMLQCSHALLRLTSGRLYTLPTLYAWLVLLMQSLHGMHAMSACMVRQSCCSVGYSAWPVTCVVLCNQHDLAADNHTHMYILSACVYLCVCRLLTWR